MQRGRRCGAASKREWSQHSTHPMPVAAARRKSTPTAHLNLRERRKVLTASGLPGSWLHGEEGRAWLRSNAGTQAGAACLFIHHKRPMRSSPHATLVSFQERAAWRTGPATPVEQQHLSTRAAGCHPTAATIASLHEKVAGAGGDDDSPLPMTRPNPFGRPKQTPHFRNWLQGQAMMTSPRDAYASSSSRKSCAKANNAALQVKQLSSAICVRRQPQIKTGTEGEQRMAALQAQTSCSCNGLTLPMTIHSPLSVHRGTRLTCRRGVGAAALVWAGELEAAQPIGQPASSRRRQHRARMAPSQLTCLQCCRPARPVWIAGRGAKRISTQARAPLAAAAFRTLPCRAASPPLGPCP